MITTLRPCAAADDVGFETVAGESPGCYTWGRAAAPAG